MSEHSVKRIAVGATATSFGDSLYSFAAPLLVYQATKDPLLSGSQVACAALGNFVGSWLVRKFMLSSSDRTATILIDILLAAIIFLPAIADGTTLVALLFVMSFVGAVLQTARSGCYESLIGHLAEGNTSVRQHLVGRLKTFSNGGALVGFAAAAPLSLALPLSGVLGINSIMYLLSAFLMRTMDATIAGTRKASRKPALQVLFGDRLKWLSIGHGLGAVALYFVNASVLFTLAGHFGASPAFISLSFACQFGAAMLGSALLSRIAASATIGVVWAPYLRLAYAVPLFAVALFDHPYAFLFSISLLAVVHAFSLPVWQSYFQASAPSDQWRVVGASRKALVSIVGAGGSVVAGYLYSVTSQRTVFVVAGCAALCSAAALCIYARSELRHQAAGAASGDGAAETIATNL